MEKHSAVKEPVEPNFRTGLEIFSSRPISLIAALILSIVICVITFMLLTLPVITGYYYAVKNSRREQYFIDLNNVTGTLSFLIKGIGRFFVQSYVFGIPAALSVLILYSIPLVVMEAGGDKGIYIGALLLVLWLPAFFLTGIFIFNGYPYLIATNDGLGALRYALSSGRSRPLQAMARGFLLLSPIPGAIVHFFMIFSYPIIAGWAVEQTAEITENGIDIAGTQKVTLGKLILVLGFAAIWLVLCYVFVTLLHSS